MIQLVPSLRKTLCLYSTRAITSSTYSLHLKDLKCFIFVEIFELISKRAVPLYKTAASATRSRTEAFLLLCHVALVAIRVSYCFLGFTTFVRAKIRNSVFDQIALLAAGIDHEASSVALGALVPVKAHISESIMSRKDWIAELLLVESIAMKPCWKRLTSMVPATEETFLKSSIRIDNVVLLRISYPEL